MSAADHVQPQICMKSTPTYNIFAVSLVLMPFSMPHQKCRDYVIVPDSVQTLM